MGVFGSFGQATFDFFVNLNPLKEGLRKAKKDVEMTTDDIDRLLKNLDAKKARRDSADRAQRRPPPPPPEPVPPRGRRGRGMGGYYGMRRAFSTIEGFGQGAQGFQGLANALPFFAYGAGASMPVAAGVAALSAAVTALAENWGHMTDVMKANWIGGSVEQFEKLRIKAEKTDEAFKDLIAKPSHFQAAHAGAVAEAIIEAEKGGPEMIRKQLTEAITASKADRSDIADKDMPGSGPFGMIPFRMLTLADQRKLRERTNAAANAKKAEDIMGGSQIAGDLGQGARDNLARLVRENPDAFRASFVGAMERASPAEVERLQEAERQSKLLKEIQAVLDKEERRGRTEEAKAGGAAATKDQLEAIVKESGLDRKFGPETIGKVLKDAMREGLNAGQAKDVLGGLPFLLGQNKTISDRIMQGPTGRKMMMGGFPEPVAAVPGGRVNQDEAAAMIRKNPLLRRANPKVRDELAQYLVHLTVEQAKDVMEGMTPEDIERHQKKLNLADKRGHPNFIGAADDLFKIRIDAAQRKPPGKVKAQADALEAAVAAQLKASGEAGDPKAIARAMRENFKGQVQAMMDTQGVNKKTAEFLVKQQAAFKAFPQLNTPAMITSGPELQKMAQLNALSLPNQLPDLAAKQLAELTLIRTYLTKQAQLVGGIQNPLPK